ncbi:hypothetical protein AB6A40_003279 [Gnathostoma spinigerum]|uniref:MAM domain-containing protein n=1 Tax=Gnathostoma spinigerum TaxID=75299 RepID=A0ABD6EAA5_9BILA
MPSHLCILVLLTNLFQQGNTCFGTNQRAFSAGPTLQQFAPLPVPPAQSPAVAASAGNVGAFPNTADGLTGVGGSFPSAVGTANVAPAAGGFPGRPAIAAANRPPLSQSVGQQKLINYLLGDKVAVADFDSNGYNAEGGGPVTAGEALKCTFDVRRPCCWANVPPSDDKLDWHLATGTPHSKVFTSSTVPDGSYLVAYTKGASPSDEAQFASCAIGCASSEIIVRARHWQSPNVLLQVCQRESFPSTVNFNPLLNCQEFPHVANFSAAQVVLPKASLVDIVFVASNFVGEEGDIAILDDIDISYESEGDECGVDMENGVSSAPNFSEGVSISSDKSPKEDEVNAAVRINKVSSNGAGMSSIHFPQTSQHLDETNSIIEPLNSDNENGGVRKASGARTVQASITSCEASKCTFEAGNTCHYVDMYESEAATGLTSRFQVVTGQFMNRVTGVKDGTEGEYYAAAFLFPREIAGLTVDLNNLTQPQRMRFQYYEGTHGVQLKACCNSLESCPFLSDRFVKVSDRTWKLTELTCPVGTRKLLFVCENTRTNQGACAVDDIQVIDPSSDDIRNSRTLC